MSVRSQRLLHNFEKKNFFLGNYFRLKGSQAPFLSNFNSYFLVNYIKKLHLYNILIHSYYSELLKIFIAVIPQLSKCL